MWIFRECQSQPRDELVFAKTRDNICPGWSKTVLFPSPVDFDTRLWSVIQSGRRRPKKAKEPKAWNLKAWATKKGRTRLNGCIRRAGLKPLAVKKGNKRCKTDR